jgi:hypothetical protein
MSSQPVHVPLFYRIGPCLAKAKLRNANGVKWRDPNSPGGAK